MPTIEVTPGPRCWNCKGLLSGLKGSALTCSARCRKAKERWNRKRDRRASDAFKAYAEECTAEALIVQQERNAEVGPNV